LFLFKINAGSGEQKTAYIAKRKPGAQVPNNPTDSYVDLPANGLFPASRVACNPAFREMVLGIVGPGEDLLLSVEGQLDVLNAVPMGQVLDLNTGIASSRSRKPPDLFGASLLPNEKRKRGI
jgi:hypothetical protein